jgi:hypothetical protein
MFYYDSSGEVIGVLNDYDLASMKFVLTDRERTGTVPFMATDLLTEKAMRGEVEHLYQHDAESFIWVLAWVSLRYEDGKLRRNDRTLDDWLIVGAKVGCRERRAWFLQVGRAHEEPSSSHESNRAIAQACLKIVSNQRTNLSPTLEAEYVFQTWFKDVLRQENPNLLN